MLTTSEGPALEVGEGAAEVGTGAPDVAEETPEVGEDTPDVGVGPVEVSSVGHDSSDVPEGLLGEEAVQVVLLQELVKCGRVEGVKASLLVVLTTADEEGVQVELLQEVV